MSKKRHSTNSNKINIVINTDKKEKRRRRRNNHTKKKSGMELAAYYKLIEKEIFEHVKALGGQVITMDIRKHNYGETEWIYANEKMIEKAFDDAFDKFNVLLLISYDNGALTFIVLNLVLNVAQSPEVK